MRKMLIGLMLMVALLSGCGAPLLGGDLMGQLQNLGPMVCTVYDFDGDGHVTTDEIGQIFGDMFPADELQEALDFYGCE